MVSVFIEILFKMLLFKGGVLIYAEHCIDSTYLQTVQNTMCKKTHTCTQYTQCTIKTYLVINAHFTPYEHILHYVHIYT